jgi:uncharacterized protein (UPF0210 family)
MYQASDIIETIKMISEDHLDIRTVTMGISLLDCANADIDLSCKKIIAKISDQASSLVEVCESLERKYGIPIINKRIAVTPISLLYSVSGGDATKYAKALDTVAEMVGVNFIGGYSALVQKGFSKNDIEFIQSIPQALAATERVCSSVNIGSTKAGINMDAVRLMGKVVKDCAVLTADRECIGAAKLVVFCNAVDDNPFMAGAFHGVGEPETVINIGVSGPGVVRSAMEKAPRNADLTHLAEIIKKTAFKITRVGQMVGAEAASCLGVPFGIVDLSLAPTPAIGDSVAHILEEMGIERVGGYGTTAALALLNDAVKKGGVMASSAVGGLSGAFIPVSEDAGMIRGVEEGTLSLEKLEAMTAVCSVGLDMIVIPGSTSPEVIAAMIADEAAIGMVNAKTTAVRVVPAIGREVGEHLDFGGLLGKGPVMPINQTSPSVLINRGGQIPAPIHSLKN